MGEGASPDRARERESLLAAMRRLGLEPDGAVADGLARYLDLLARWSAVYNLTAIRDRTEMRIQHLHDSLAIAAALRRSVPGGDRPRVLDVGSGAGLPGLVVAACWPQARVDCLDSVGKKVAFVAQAAGELGLRNVQAVHARIEAHRPSTPYDVVTARAFSSLADAVGSTRHALAPDGVWALAKGKMPDDERRQLPPDVDVFHVERLTVPDLDAERHLVWIRPQPADSRLPP